MALSWRGPWLVYGIPLAVWIAILVIGLAHREDLEQAGLTRVYRTLELLVPMVVLALLVAVAAFLGRRDLDSAGERRVSRAAATKWAIFVTLLLIVFPLLPVVIVHVMRGRGLEFTAIILMGVCVAGLQLVWPLLLGSIIDRDHALEDELRDRVRSLAEAASVPVEGVLVALTDDDDDEDPPNAFICGLGRSRRIVIEDGLARLLEPDELDAIVAHEFAHASEHHIAKKIAVLLAMGLGLTAVDRMQGAASLGGILVLGMTCILAVLLKLALDRNFEFVADRTAADWVGAHNLRNALAGLAARGQPSKLPPWLATHPPPLLERIRRLEKMAIE